MLSLQNTKGLLGKYELVRDRFLAKTKFGTYKISKDSFLNYFVRGEPGCGKSFLIIYWSFFHIKFGFQVLVLVPYRRLAIQMKDLFEQINSSAKEIDNLNISVLEGNHPNIQEIKNSHLIISTYEHGYKANQFVGGFTCVVIDEIHNFFYPNRGWQLEPFLDSERFLFLSGTINDEEIINLSKRTSFGWLNKKVDLKIRLYRMDDLRRWHDSRQKYNNLKFFKVVKNTFLDNGGIFYFYPRINSLVLKAYKLSKKFRIPIINPLEDEEINLLQSKVKINELKNQIVISQKDLIKSCFESSIYIDFSSHFNQEIRDLLGKEKNCKVNVFCTTTLCEGLNLPSIKVVYIASGQWDWRRVNQIKGRAGRFQWFVPIFQGAIVPKEQEELKLDLFDQIIIDLRGQMNKMLIYKSADLKSSIDPEKVLNNEYKHAIDYLRRNNFQSFQGWLNSRLGIKRFIKYKEFLKVKEKNETVIKDFDNRIIEEYNQHFLPLFELNFFDLFKLPFEDEEE